MNFYQYSIMALLVAMTVGTSLAMERDDRLVTGRSIARRQAAQQRALQREEELFTEQQAQANEALPTEEIQEQASVIASILSNESTFTQSQPFVDERPSSEREEAALQLLQLQALPYNQKNKKPAKAKIQAEPTDADFKKAYAKVKLLR